MRRILALGLIALLSAAAAQAGPATRTVLDNGLTVLAVQSDHVRVAGIALVIEASGGHETDADRGSRALLQQMVSVSSHKAVTEDLRPISAIIRSGSSGLAVNTNWDFVETTFTAAVEELDAGLALLADEVFEVELTQEKLDEARALVESTWDASRQSPVQATFDLFRQALYGDSPMARPQQGDPESVAAITLEGLQQFRDTHYVPANACLCIVSPLTAAEATGAVGRAFGELATRPAPPAPPAFELPTQSRIEVGDSADLLQASMAVGVPLPAYGDPAFPAAEVVAALLEGPGGRLRRDLGLLQGLGLALPTRLLEEHYPISVLTIPQARHPYLAVHVLAAPRSVERARVGVLRHLLALQSGSVTEAEMERAKARVINLHRLRTQSPTEAALYLARRALFGLGGADEAVAAVEALTPEDLTAVAVEYFDRHAVALQMPGS
ncbi:MAG: M16 family metallopeptidase [Armatimonadota bacterium]|jgi:zinc protease